MAISSMTGFARSQAGFDGLHWQWEAKSVNGRSLDVRFRLPPGFEALEQPLRAAVAAKLMRGNVQVSLTVSGHAGSDSVKVNEAVLEQVLAAGERLRDRIGGEPLRADLILSLRGVLEVIGAEEDEETLSRRNAQMFESFAEVLSALLAMRRQEGARLATLVSEQVRRIETLTLAARDNPARSTEAISARLAEQVKRLMEAASGLDEARLHQEAVLIAARADIQEELDRLMSHVEAARELLAEGGAVGRKFDFLAQEFNREANTLCSKAIDKSLTLVGLELKTVIDQMREQVQNIE